jgi:hypothetical protein
VEHTSHIPQFIGQPGDVSKNQLPAVLCGIIFSISAGVGSAEDSAVQGKGQIDAKSFRCITEMTHVRQFYVDNLLGNLDATLAVANSATGGTYPEGSVIQLVPTEAMVNREKGFNSVTHDWEFFELTSPRTERKFEKGDLPKWSIALEETALVVTFKPVRSGMSCAKWTTVALQIRLRAP